MPLAPQDQRHCQRHQQDHAGGKAVAAIGQVESVGGGNQRQRRHRDDEDAHPPGAEEGHHLVVQAQLPEPEPDGQPYPQLHHDLLPRQQATAPGAGSNRDEVVDQAQAGAEAERRHHRQQRPRAIDESERDQDKGDHNQATGGRGAALGEVRPGAFLTDALTHAVPAEQADRPRHQHHADTQGEQERHRRRPWLREVVEEPRVVYRGRGGRVRRGLAQDLG